MVTILIAALLAISVPPLKPLKLKVRVYPIPGFTPRQLQLIEETDQFYRDLYRP
jgi:hypothetical protein